MNDKPSDVQQQRGIFDSFADKASVFTAKAYFFCACILVVLVWAATGPIFKFNETWQLIINTGTTIVTFLLVALFQNAQQRFENTMNKKTNAIADALSDLLNWTADQHADSPSCTILRKHATELREAVGLEHREST